MRDLARRPLRLGGMGLDLLVTFRDDLYVRELAYDNGITIVSDRGIDLYKPITSSRELANLVTEAAAVKEDITTKGATILGGLNPFTPGLKINIHRLPRRPRENVSRMRKDTPGVKQSDFGVGQIRVSGFIY